MIGFGSIGSGGVWLGKVRYGRVGIHKLCSCDKVGLGIVWLFYDRVWYGKDKKI
jgi:hypothetical protein